MKLLQKFDTTLFIETQCSSYSGCCCGSVVANVNSCHRPSACLSPVRLSVCLSVVCRSCILLRHLKFLAMFLRHLVPWRSADIEYYVDRPRGTPPSGS